MDRYACDATLGNLIDWLKPAVEDNPGLPAAFELYGLGKFQYQELCSYRGFYSELAIIVKPYLKAHSPPSIGDLHTDLSSAVGRSFRGYKGGDFTMDKSSSVYVVDDYSHTGYFRPMWNPGSLVFILGSEKENLPPEKIVV